MRETVLLSILPQWADAILDGKKEWEYRRVAPRVDKGTRLVLYASHRRCAIVGEATIERIIYEPVNDLLRHTIHETPHTRDEVKEYFKGLDCGSAIAVYKPRAYATPITLDDIRKAVPGYRPPQSYQFLRPGDPAHRRILKLLP
jgi:predicted transcriptional regulator